MGQWPQFSYPYPEILNKLNARGGNNSPMPYANASAGVSGLSIAIKCIKNNIDFTIYEKENYIGGLWNITPLHI